MSESDQVTEQGLDPAQLAGAVEALLIMAEEPLPAVSLASALHVTVDEVTGVLVDLAAFYLKTGRGFELRHVGGGWRYYTRPEYAELISASILEGQSARLSQAALETLAVIAYLQPISRGRISAVRGVNVDGVVRTLLARDLIVESGHDDETGAALFTTSDLFLEKLGLTSLDELPPLAPHLPDAHALEAELAALSRPAELPPEPAGELPAEPAVETITQPEPVEESHE